MTEDATQAAAAPTATADPATGQQGTEKAPPWADGEFDAERAWKKIQALEADKEKLSKRPVLDAATKQKLAEYDRLTEAQKTEAQKAAEETARWQTEAETWRTAAVASKVQALAAADFTDPDDAVRNLDPAKYLDPSGVIDEKAIKADLDSLLDAKPHYRRAESTPRVPAPNRNQGSSGRPATDPAQEFAAILQSGLRQ